MEKTEMSLMDAREAAQKVYEQLIDRERVLMGQLEETRAQRFRQEGYIAALDQILAAAQGNNNGYQEEGTRQGQMDTPVGQEGREGGEEVPA